MVHFGRTAFVLVIALFAITARGFSETKGSEIFNKNCARCHGTDGRAKTPAAAKLAVANLHSPKVQSQSDAELFDGIGYGKRHIQYPHAFLLKGMTEDQVRALVAHIRTFK